MELFGLKDKDGKEYKITIIECNLSPDMIIKKIESIESEPQKKKLPKTKEELKSFFNAFADRDQGDLYDFLKDYED